MAGKRQERNSITFGTNNTENQFPLQQTETPIDNGVTPLVASSFVDYNTPKPKIDRAELISMVEHIGLYGTAKETVQMAVELLNEVNKVCNDIN
jgi:hypothetical protein